LNGNISATGHLIHFLFGSRVGFSESADQMVLFRFAQIQDSGHKIGDRLISAGRVVY